MKECSNNRNNEKEFSIRYALKILSGKWKLQILWQISYHKIIRFNELQRSLDGISSLMLTRCLRELSDYKLITRKQFNEVPPHVEYSLTDLGKALCPILNSLEEWGDAVLRESDKIID